MTSTIINKVLVKQFGASKPPWVEKYLFYKLPFNYCDRWCERCRISAICRVYQVEKERDKRFIKKGIDPKSTKAMFLSLKESIEEVRKLLERDLKRFNIKVTEEDSKKYEAEEERTDRLVNNDRLTKIARKLCFSLVEATEDLHYYFQESQPNSLNEPFTILRYYIYFFYVKIQRAVDSENDDEIDKEFSVIDAKNSAFLSYASIVKIINALKVISQNKRINHSIKQGLGNLIDSFKKLNVILEKRFNFNLNTRSSLVTDSL